MVCVADGMMSAENPKELTQKNFLELINDYNKVSGYKVNI